MTSERYTIDVGLADDGTCWWVIHGPNCEQIAGGCALNEATARDVATLVVARFEGRDLIGELRAARAELERVRECNAHAMEKTALILDTARLTSSEANVLVEVRALLTPEVPRE